MAKEGSTVSGLMDTFATSVSLALQYGVPLRDLVNKFAHVRFEPSGFTGNQEIPIAKSIVDYIFRWIGSRFLPADEKAQIGLIDRSAMVDSPSPSPSVAVSAGVPPPRRARPDRRGRSVGRSTRPRRSRPTDRPSATAIAADPSPSGPPRPRRPSSRSSRPAPRPSNGAHQRQGQRERQRHAL